MFRLSRQAAIIIIVAAVAACVVIIQIPTLASDPSIDGQWSQLYSWPEVAVHMAILPDGRVMSFTDPQWNDGLQTPASAYIVTIPSGGAPSASAYIPNGTDDIWCAGATFFADGRLLVVGGTTGNGVSGPGITAFNVFDWRTTGWSAGTAMEYARWYPTATTLADGEILVLSGSEDLNYTNASTPEITTMGGTGPWRELNTAVLNLTLYPRSFLAPNGKVFVAAGGSPPGANQVSRYLDTSGTGAWSTVGSSLFGGRYNGTAAMYDDGKVLIAGGTTNFSVDPSTNTAEVIDLGTPSPSWRYTNSMAFARQYANSTLLPDGKVLVTGGTSASDNVLDSGAALAAEMWDPATETWTTMASMNHARLYHSTAALLPDGRVISAGGTTTGVMGNDVDFYSPPYLFKGTRPVITSAPASVTYGQTFTVQTPDSASIDKVNWIRLSAVTHAFNENQRINRLSFTTGSGALGVTAPSNPNLCPPGHYMLFILNGNGVPSLARVVKISSGAPTPTPSSTSTATATPRPTSTPTATSSSHASPTPTATSTPAVTLVTGVNASTSTSAVSSLVTNGWTPQAGDMLGVFVEIASTSVSVSSVTDRLGNIYSQAASRTGSSGRVEFWYSIGIKGGSTNAVTISFSNATKAVVRGEEFAGIPSKVILLTVNANAGAIPGTSASTGSITTTAAPSYMLAGIGWDTAATASATQGGFNRIGQLSDGDSTATVSYLFAIASDTGTFGTGVTLSTSSAWQGAVAAFAAGATSTPTPSLTRTPTPTATGTPSRTATMTPSRTTTLTPSPTVTPKPSTTSTPTTVPTPTPTPEVSLSPTSLSFGNQTVGASSAAKVVTLTNAGGATLLVSSIATTGDFAQANGCGSSVAAGGSCAISVNFRPTVKGGRSGTLSISDNATGSPHLVSLSGRGR